MVKYILNSFFDNHNVDMNLMINIVVVEGSGIVVHEVIIEKGLHCLCCYHWIEDVVVVVRF